MGLALFTMMIVVPILEITVFILVGRYIGLWPTLACILLTALIGTVIIRFQGSGLIATARKSIAAGEAPVGEVLQGLALLTAGALLITPGFITDTLGFLLLIPPLRRRLAAAVVAQATRRAEVRMGAARAGPGPGARAKPAVVIEGEWQEVEPETAASPEPGRGWGSSEAAPADGGAPDLPPASRAGG
jgi:UPF0716 protein FxsA